MAGTDGTNMDAVLRPDPPHGWCLQVGNRSVTIGTACDLRGTHLPAPIDPTIGRPTSRHPATGRPLRVSSIPRIDDRSFTRFVRRSLRALELHVEGPDVTPELVDSLVHLAAAGVVVRPRHLSELEAALGTRFAETLSRSFEIPDRELRSVHIRRAAIETHGARGWAERLMNSVGSEERGLEKQTLSVLLATRRPEHLRQAVRQVAQQRRIDVQLIAGLHGDGFAPHVEEMTRNEFAGDVIIRRFGSELVLGEVLSELTAAADGALVTKWDDDDWYGADHLSDLLLAHDYSGADVVGKRAEFVYLERSDLTIRRSTYGSESVDWSLAGGTLLMSRAWLEQIGGWEPLARGVDRSVLDRTRAHGGVAYRTHGYQYVLRRSAVSDHTWAADDDYFLQAATERRRGLALSWADITSLP